MQHPHTGLSSMHGSGGRRGYTSYLQRPQYQRRTTSNTARQQQQQLQQTQQQQQQLLQKQQTQQPQQQFPAYEESRTVTFDPSAATSEALAAASAINLCEEVLKTPASKPRRMSLRRMSIEGLLDSTAPSSDKENGVHEDNIIRYESRERGDTESAIKKRIHSQINSVSEGGSFFSTSPGSFLLGGDRKRRKSDLRA